MYIHIVCEVNFGVTEIKFYANKPTLKQSCIKTELSSVRHLGYSGAQP